MSEAEWTVGEAAELARDRREGFVLSPAFFRRAKLQTAMVVTGVAILGVALVPLFRYHYGDEGFAFIALAILSLGSIPLARQWERRQEARHETEGWISRTAGVPGQIPPLTLGPDLPSIASLGVRARLGTLVWPTAVLFALLAGIDGPTNGLTVGLVGLLALFWTPARSPRRAWRAVRDRESLEAYNRDQ